MCGSAHAVELPLHHRRRDSESRKKIRELLAAEETMKAMKGMAVDGSDWETDDGGMQSE